MAIPMMGYIIALAFPIYINMYKRDVMDMHRDTEVNVTIPVSKDIAMEEGTQSKPTATDIATLETAEQENRGATAE